MRYEGSEYIVNTNKLRGMMAEKGTTAGKLAKSIGINQSTFSAKMSSGKFTIEEADNIVKVLGLTCEEATSIFFSQLVA
jgi:DNA-binding Xre family transcriptional regulator